MLFRFELNPSDPSSIDKVPSKVVVSGNTAVPTILVITEGGKLTPAQVLTIAALTSKLIMVAAIAAAIKTALLLLAL